MFIGAYCICLFGFGNGTLQTSTLTGAKIKEMAKEGCDLNGNGYPYPYVLLTKDGTDLEDEKEYTVVICGFLKGMEDELNQQDTGIVGLDAAKEYLKNVKEVSSGTPDDSLVKEQKKKTIMCTDVVIEENTYYMVLKKLDGYDWSMLMLVPTSDHYAQMCLRVADNGIGMSKEFRNSSHPLAKKIPILAMTANAFSEDVQNAFNACMNAHIVKPVDMKVLIKTVRNLQTGAGAAGTLN